MRFLSWLKDARRYRLLREELCNRWVLGETIYTPEELDERCDHILSGKPFYELQEPESGPLDPIREYKPPPMPGWTPLNMSHERISNGNYTGEEMRQFLAKEGTRR